MRDGTEADGTEGDVLATIRAGEVEWVCDHTDGTREDCFETGLAVAALLAAEVILVNAPWHRNDLGEADRRVAQLLVDSSDVFVWACADADPLPMAGIERLYRAWRADPKWGSAAWCIAERRKPAQPPVAGAMREAGTWDPDRLHLEGPPYLDARIGEIAVASAARP